MSPPSTLDAEHTGTWVFSVQNTGMNPQPPLQLRVDFTPIPPVDGTVVAVPPGCQAVNARQTACEPVSLAPGEVRQLEYRFRLTGPHGKVSVLATFGGAYTYATSLFTREYAVTSVADTGPGSLRQALLDVNRDCTGADIPCAPVFRIDGPVPAEGWFTIRPLSPLPPVTAHDFTLDGRMQTLHTGDTNPAGPEIMLDGSGTWHHGMQFDGSIARISDIAIGNFPGNGVASAVWQETRIERCHVGMDPSGTVAAPNGLRGAQIERGSIVVTDSLLAGNARSGGWFEVREHVTITRNRFIGNGASGFYFKLIPAPRNDVAVYDNVISGNAHAGISLDRTSKGDLARNHFHGNLGRAIDIGIDGPTLAMSPGLPAVNGGVVGAPVITSARYENVETVIEALIAPRNPQNPFMGETVYFYASSDGRDGGELLGSVKTIHTDLTGRHVLRVPRDLRGRWVSAATFAQYLLGWDEVIGGTSEVGLPRLVE